MFEVFGEFDTFEELNMAAEGFKNEGDKDSLFKLAEENGIARGFADMYLAGGIPQLCDVATAAIGKIEVESADLKLQEIHADWADYIKGMCEKKEDFARAVRKKGKSLKGCIAVLLKWSFEHRYKVNSEIVKLVGIRNAQVEEGLPGMGTAKKLIREYYLG